jgi:hypothetical protein
MGVKAHMDPCFTLKSGCLIVVTEAHMTIEDTGLHNSFKDLHNFHKPFFFYTNLLTRFMALKNLCFTISYLYKELFEKTIVRFCGKILIK